MVLATRADFVWEQKQIEIWINKKTKEGATGVGKSTLTYKLEKMGYRCVFVCVLHSFSFF